METDVLLSFLYLFFKIYFSVTTDMPHYLSFQMFCFLGGVCLRVAFRERSPRPQQAAELSLSQH